MVVPPDAHKNLHKFGWKKHTWFGEMAGGVFVCQVLVGKRE